MPQAELQNELAAAIAAARAAGALLLKQFQSAPTVLSEIGRDIKLQADRDAEALILAQLAPLGYPALAEESGAHGDFERGLAWAIDPLDGTLNFARGIPLNCVSIGLMRDLRPILGVIYDFHHDELFWGIPDLANPAGLGRTGLQSRAGERPLHLSTVTDPLLSTYAVYPAGKVDDPAPSPHFLTALRRFKRLRIPGSAALQLAWVADGRYEIYAEDDIMLWDIAAGLAIARAAGAVYTLELAPYHAWARYCRCACNPELLEILKKEPTP